MFDIPKDVADAVAAVLLGQLESSVVVKDAHGYSIKFDGIEIDLKAQTMKLLTSGKTIGVCPIQGGADHVWHLSGFRGFLPLKVSTS